MATSKTPRDMINKNTEHIHTKTVPVDWKLCNCIHVWKRLRGKDMSFFLLHGVSLIVFPAVDGNTFRRLGDGKGQNMRKQFSETLQAVRL